MNLRSLVSAVAGFAAAAFVAGSVFAGTQKDIVDTAVDAGQFKTLVAAVQAAGLVDTLKGDGPYTVFAPTDEAFAKLPEGTVENLLKPENKDQLVAVLTYHVVPGKVMSSDIAGKKIEAATVQGSELSFAAGLRPRRLLCAKQEHDLSSRSRDKRCGSRPRRES